MKCLFCNNECVEIEPVDKFINHICGKHKRPIEYLVDPETLELSAWVFQTTYQGRQYTVEAYYFPWITTLEIFRSPEEEEKPHYDDVPAVKFNYIPDNITPDNIDDKIATLLVFS